MAGKVSDKDGGWLKVFREEERRLGNANARHHHWWPLALQKEWQRKGTLKRWPRTDGAANHKFGAEKGGHDVIVLTPHGRERFVYEGVFRDVDNSIKRLLTELRRILSQRSLLKDSLAVLRKAYAVRFRGLPPTPSEPAALGLARVACSVSIRSPGNRRQLAAREIRFWGCGEASAVGNNVVQQWRHAEEAFAACEMRLNMIFIRSSPKAFVFPDAFPPASVIDTRGIGPSAKSKLLFPILPDVCIVGLLQTSTRDAVSRCWLLDADLRRASDINAYLASISGEYLYGLEGTDYQTGSASAGKAFLDDLWKSMR